MKLMMRKRLDPTANIVLKHNSLILYLRLKNLWVHILISRGNTKKNLFKDNITDSTEKDENNNPEVIDEHEHLHTEFDMDGNIGIKY